MLDQKKIQNLIPKAETVKIDKSVEVRMSSYLEWCHAI